MAGYLLLFILPCVTAPVQSLLASAGRRFDLGCLHYVSVTAVVVAALCNRSATGPQVAWALLAGTVFLVVPFRVLTLAYLKPQAFTLVSLGQLWMTTALLGYTFDAAGVQGIDAPSVRIAPAAAAAVALAYAVLAGVGFRRWRLPARLAAATESPEQYGLMIGSRLRLALVIEAIALMTYTLAGVLFAVASNHISTASFENEATWILLPAMISKPTGGLRLVGPAMLSTIVRYFASQLIAATYSELITYVVFWLALMIAWTWHGRGHRVARA